MLTEAKLPARILEQTPLPNVDWNPEEQLVSLEEVQTEPAGHGLHYSYWVVLE